MGSVNDDVIEVINGTTAPGIHVRQPQYSAVERGPV